MTPLTLVYVVKENEVCLGYKKRGFGDRYWNGFGGKLEKGETMRQAAVREVYEESTITMTEDSLKQVGLFDFIFVDKKHLQVSVFFSKDWSGEPSETEEMKPKWFPFDSLPYDEMWMSDILWLPRVLTGEKMKGTFYFDETGRGLEKHACTAVQKF